MKGKAEQFQFQNGTIMRKFPNVTYLTKMYFNSKMVRLWAHAKIFGYLRGCQFQFQNGTIMSLSFSTNK